MSLRPHLIHGRSGFSLIEVLIAVSIFTVGLLGVASMQISAIRGNAFSDHTTTALCLAEDRMEDLMSRDFDDGALDDTTLTNNDDLYSAARVDHEERINAAGEAVAGGPYRRIWNIADSTDPPMKRIVVMVSWDNGGHHVSLTSLVTRE